MKHSRNAVGGYGVQIREMQYGVTRNWNWTVFKLLVLRITLLYSAI